MKLRQFRPGFALAGTIAWTNTHTRAVTARIRCTADLRDPATAHITIAYTQTVRGAATPFSYNVELTTTRPHFGGLRWWFVCPMSGRRVRCLHLAPHCPKFASRAYLGLGYKVQRESWEFQRMRAARVADARLGGDGCLGGEPPPKPKRMHWATYHNLCEVWEREAFRSFLGSRLVADCDLARAEIARDPSLVVGRR